MLAAQLIARSDYMGTRAAKGNPAMNNLKKHMHAGTLTPSQSKASGPGQSFQQNRPS